MIVRCPDVCEKEPRMSRFHQSSSGSGPELPGLDSPSARATGPLGSGASGTGRWGEGDMTPRRSNRGMQFVLLAALLVLPLAGGLAWVVRSGVLDDPFAEAMEQGRLAAAADHEAEALEAFRKAQAIRPGQYEPALETAVVLFGMGQFGEALAWAGQAVTIRPQAAEALNLRGLCQYHLGNSGEARNDFRAALVVAPDYPAPHLNIANILVEQEDRAGAIRELETFLRLTPDFEQQALVRENLERLRQGKDAALPSGRPG